MGFSWSSYVAQTVMVGCCLRVGLPSAAILADETKVPDSMSQVVGVATDDIMHFSNQHPQIGREWMDELEKVFQDVSLKTNAQKDIVGTKNVTCVGIDIIDGVSLGPSLQQLWKVLSASLDLFTDPKCAPNELASYTGTTQWFDLFNRWLLSCLDETYAFNRGDDPGRVRALPSSVLSELMLNIALAPFWEVSLCRPWLDMLVATDASPSYGFGVCQMHPCSCSSNRTCQP